MRNAYLIHVLLAKIIIIIISHSISLLFLQQLIARSVLIALAAKEIFINKHNKINVEIIIRMSFFKRGDLLGE